MPNGKTRLEWLRDSPASRKIKGLADHIAKIGFLKKLGADRLQLGLPAGMLKAQARSMLYRKPATLNRMRGERKTIEIARFFRLQLLRLTDDGLGMIDYRIADLWRQASVARSLEHRAPEERLIPKRNGKRNEHGSCETSPCQPRRREHPLDHG